jgi:hypothetical protein
MELVTEVQAAVSCCSAEFELRNGRGREADFETRAHPCQTFLILNTQLVHDMLDKYKDSIGDKSHL